MLTGDKKRLILASVSRRHISSGANNTHCQEASKVGRIHSLTKSPSDFFIKRCSVSNGCLETRLGVRV